MDIFRSIFLKKSPGTSHLPVDNGVSTPNGVTDFSDVVEFSLFTKAVLFLRRIYLFIITNVFSYLFIFLLVQFWLLVIFYHVPKCYRNNYIAKQDVLEEKLFSLNSRIGSMLEEFNFDGQHVRREGLSNCIGYYELCGNPPAANWSQCDPRFGHDSTCFCLGRRVYPYHGMWIKGSDSEDVGNFLCDYSVRLTRMFKELYNLISNEAVSVVEIFLSLDSHTHFIYPGRLEKASLNVFQKIEDDYSLPYLDISELPQCLLMPGTLNAKSKLCSKNRWWGTGVSTFAETSVSKAFTRKIENVVVVLGGGGSFEAMELLFNALETIFENMNVMTNVFGVKFNSFFTDFDAGRKDDNLFYSTQNRLDELGVFFSNIQPTSCEKFSLDALSVFLEDHFSDISHVVLLTDCVQGMVYERLKRDGENMFIFEDEDDTGWAETKTISVISTLDLPAIEKKNVFLYNTSADSLTGFLARSERAVPQGTIMYVEGTGETSPFHFSKKKDLVLSAIGLNLEDISPFTQAIAGFVFYREAFYESGGIEEYVLLERNSELLNKKRKLDRTQLIFVLYVGAPLVIVLVVFFRWLFVLLQRRKSCSEEADAPRNCLDPRGLVTSFIQDDNIFKSYCILGLTVFFLAHRLFDIELEGVTKSNLFGQVLSPIIVFCVIVLVYCILPFLTCRLKKACTFRSGEVFGGEFKERNIGSIGVHFGIKIQDYIVCLHDYVGYVPRIVFPPAKLIGIVGHSSSGKTLFARYLLSNPVLVSEVHGDIEVYVKFPESGKGIKGKINSLLEMRQYVGYVPQENILPEFLTVKELIYFNLSQHYKYSRKIVDVVLTQLDLLPYLDNLPRELSGGTLKRFSIADTLSRGCPIQILDEPSSGLDEALSLRMYQMLKRLTHCGFTIICNIHQPSQDVIDLLDEVYMFGLHDKKMRGFRVPKKKKVIDRILRTYNGETIIQEKNSMEELSNLVKEEEDGLEDSKFVWHTVLTQEIKHDKSILDRTDLRERLYFLFARSILEELRNWKNLFIELLNCFLAGLVHVYLFSNGEQFRGVTNSEFDSCVFSQCSDASKDLVGECSSDLVSRSCAYPRFSNIWNTNFSLIFGLAFISTSSALSYFARQKRLIKKECWSIMRGYLFYFFTAKMIVKLLRCVLVTFAFLMIHFSGLCVQGSFLEYFVTLLAVNYWCTAFGVMVSLLFSEEKTYGESFMFGIVVLFTNTYLSSIFVPSQNFVSSLLTQFVGVTKYLSYAYYAINQLFSVEVDTYKDRYPRSVEHLLNYHEFGYSQWNNAILFIMGSLFLLFALVCLYLFYSSEFVFFLEKLRSRFSKFSLERSSIKKITKKLFNGSKDTKLRSKKYESESSSVVSSSSGVESESEIMTETSQEDEVSSEFSENEDASDSCSSDFSSSSSTSNQSSSFE